MPRLNHKQRAARCVTDIRELKIVEHIKRQYGQQMLTCKNEDLAPLRLKSQMLDDLVDELGERANRGKLTYVGNSA